MEVIWGLGPREWGAAYGVLDVAFLLRAEGTVRLALVDGNDEMGELAVDECRRGVEAKAQS